MLISYRNSSYSVGALIRLLSQGFCVGSDMSLMLDFLLNLAISLLDVKKRVLSLRVGLFFRTAHYYDTDRFSLNKIVTSIVIRK